MQGQKNNEKCIRCDSDLHGQFCSNCGHSHDLKRIDSQYIFQEIGSVLSFEKGILFTIRELIVRPGQNIRTFILEDRNRLVKPIVFIIVCSLIFTIAHQFLRFEDGYVNYQNSNDSVTVTLFEWVQGNYGYANIIMAIFIAFWIKILFKKYDYNFFEILILLCFVMGIGMLMYTVFGIVEGLTKFRILHIGGAIGILYSSWAIGQFFDSRKIMNYLKGLLSYMLGMLSFSLAVIALGATLDFLMK